MNRKQNSQYALRNHSLLGFTADKDGVDHINIYSMGKTELGKALSHFSHTPFTHPYFGSFYSMEGFWYFMRSGMVEDRLRYLSGFRAKQVGKDLPYRWYKDFKEDIVAGNYQKIIQHEHIRELMIASELPFDHYYTHTQGPTSVLVIPKPTEWLVEGFEDIRLALKEGVVPSVWVEAEKRYLKK